jgi:hypothetical protein
MSFLFCPVNKGFCKLQGAAEDFASDKQAFYDALGDIGHVKLDRRVVRIAEKINSGGTVRYCGRSLSEFPATYAYLQKKSKECVDRIGAIVKKVVEADDEEDVPFAEFSSQAREDIRAMNFGLYEAPVIQAAADEAQGLKGRGVNEEEASFYVALPPLIALRLLTREQQFTELDCPVLISGTREIWEMGVLEGYENSKAGAIAYLNSVQAWLQPKQNSLREEIYENLSNEDASYSDECKLLFQISSALSRGENAAAMNHCMKLASESL